MIDRKNGIVNKHAKGVEFLMKKNKVDVIKGYATIKGAGTVEVKTDKGVETLETKNILMRHRIRGSHAARHHAGP